MKAGAEAEEDGGMTWRNPGRRIPGARLGLAGAGLGLGALYLVETLRYPRGTAAQPGPGLYPILVAVTLIVACLGVALETWLERPQRPAEAVWPEAAARLRTGAILLAGLGYIVLLTVLGHMIAGTLALLVVFRVMEMRRWWTAGVVAVSMAVLSYFLFVTLLGVPLPRGEIWDIWD
jgi:hypothetical protein